MCKKNCHEVYRQCMTAHCWRLVDSFRSEFLWERGEDFMNDGPRGKQARIILCCLSNLHLTSPDDFYCQSSPIIADRLNWIFFALLWCHPPSNRTNPLTDVRLQQTISARAIYEKHATWMHVGYANNRWKVWSPIDEYSAEIFDESSNENRRRLLECRRYDIRHDVHMSVEAKAWFWFLETTCYLYTPVNSCHYAVGLTCTYISSVL